MIRRINIPGTYHSTAAAVRTCTHSNTTTVLMLLAAACCSTFAPDRDSRVLVLCRCLPPDMVTAYFAPVFFSFCSGIFFFKQKTAYEIASCLVGSEMCIRDRCCRIYRKSSSSRQKASSYSTSTAVAVCCCEVCTI